MKFSHILSLLFFISLSSFAVGQSSFDNEIKFQNNYDKDIYISIAYHDDNPFTMGGQSPWTKMWFKCKAGKSLSLKFPSFYGEKYYHAHVDGDKSINWGAGTKFYLHPTKGYTILQEDKLGVEEGFLHASDLSGHEIQLKKSELDEVQFTQIKMGMETVVIE